MIVVNKNMSDSRLKNTARNILSGLLLRIVSILLPFLNRTIILWTLGVEFTGLTGLFSSILGVLSIAELGFNSAVVFSLYRPMADRDEKQIIYYVSILEKIYKIVGSVIFVIGVGISFFLKTFICGDYPDTVNIYVVYYLELCNSAISYFLFSYKECLLLADQRADIGNQIRTIISVIRYIAQGIVLIAFRDYYAYLALAIIGTVTVNLLIQRETKIRYPFFKKIKSKLEIPKDILKQVSGLMIDKVCNTCRNSFDSLIISSFIGLTATAIYGNYYYVYNALYGVMLTICNAMSASVGNGIIKKTESENYDDLCKFSFIFSWILGVSTTMMVSLYQPFMKIWVGEDLMLSNFNMYLFCLYFFWINMTNIRTQYITGTGMWWRMKILYVMEALSNLCLNLFLGKLFGITGVIVATIITVIVFNWYSQNVILFKNYFKHESLVQFSVDQIYYFVVTGISCGISIFACSRLNSEGVLKLIIIAVISAIVSNMVFFLIYRKYRYFNNSKSFVFKLVKVIKK